MPAAKNGDRITLAKVGVKLDNLAEDVGEVKQTLRDADLGGMKKDIAWLTRLVWGALGGFGLLAAETILGLLGLGR